MARYAPGSPLFCEAHRNTVWAGHLECAREDGGCGRTYKRAATAPLVCACNRRLLPMNREPRLYGDQQFTGRALCGTCFSSIHRSSAVVSESVAIDDCG
jgi:hypothetical protein